MVNPLIDAYQPTAANPFDRVKAAHLLNRAGFGGTPDEIGKVLALGPAKAVDWLLDFPDKSAEDQDAKDVPSLKSIEGYPETFRELAKMFAGKSLEEKKALRQKLMAANRQALLATARWWMERMVHGPHPLQEKLTLFWHGHFTTSAKDERAAKLMWEQNELLRRNAAGNFPKFVQAVARDPAMLDYLNNQQNKKAHPNENFARELMELFTLGIGNYTEDDVKQAARAFTGWSHDGDEYVFRRYEHDDDSKTFMGRRGDFNGDDVINIILAQPVCPRYITGKIVSFFAYEDPEEPVVNGLAEIFRDSDGELRPLLQAMFRSNAFYSPRAIGSQIKSPIQLVVGTVRLLDASMPATRPQGLMAQMGQVPFFPPNVKGWPGGRMWINTSTLFVRYNVGLTLAAEAGAVEREQGSVEEVVDRWVARLIQRPIDPDQRKVLVDALGDRTDTPSVRHMVQLIVSMPEYQLC